MSGGVDVGVSAKKATPKDRVWSELQKRTGLASIGMVPWEMGFAVLGRHANGLHAQTHGNGQAKKKPCPRGPLVSHPDCCPKEAVACAIGIYDCFLVFACMGVCGEGSGRGRNRNARTNYPGTQLDTLRMRNCRICLGGFWLILQSASSPLHTLQAPPDRRLAAASVRYEICTCTAGKTAGTGRTTGHEMVDIWWRMDRKATRTTRPWRWRWRWR